MFKRLTCATITLALLIAAGAKAGELLTYGSPPLSVLYSQHNDDYTVRVRQPGGVWQDLYEYRIQVDGDTKQNASLVYFDFTGMVEVQVEKNNGDFKDVSFLPAAEGIRPTVQGHVVDFTLSHPESFSLQFDGDRLHNLHILAGAPPSSPPEGPNVKIYAPGVYTPEDGATTFPVVSGQTIYLEGGAILKGNFELKGVHDVKIMGRGLLLNTGRAIELDNAQNVDIDNLITVNDDKQNAARVMNIRHSVDVRVRDISGFTSGRWSDGINISTSQHVSVDHVYLRTSDDAVVVYAVSDCPICPSRDDKAPSPLSYDTFDIKVADSTIWTDVAHALYVGHFGDLTHPRVIHDVSFDNIDVVNLDEDDPAWEGVMAIFSGDATRIENIRFSDIRVDRIEEGKLINIVAGDNPRYNKAPGRGIRGVLLRNISYTGDGLPGSSIITGLSPQTQVSDVAIEKLSIAGKAVRAPADGDIEVGEYVHNLTFK